MTRNITDLWYAVMADREDTDWGDGTWSRWDAVEKAKYLRYHGYPEAYVAVIDDSTANPVCVEEIHDLYEE